MDALQLRDNAKQQLAEIKTIETGVEYLNKVKAIETWAKAEKKDAELQNIIAEQKLRTQRILGKLLKNKDFVSNQYDKNAPFREKAALSDFDLTYKQSHEFQQIASLEQEIFEEEIATAKEETNKRIELTTSRMLKVAKDYELQQQNKENENTANKLDVLQNIKQGDCLDLLNKIDDNSIDVVITDPPYGINYKSNRSELSNSITKRGLLNDIQEDAFKLLDSVCKLLLDKTSDNAHLYFFCSWSVFVEFKTIISKYFTVKTPIVWDKGNKGSGDLETDWGNQTELIIYCIKGKKKINYRKGNVLNVPKLHTSKMIHPTQKPTELITELLEVSANHTDTVLDPFMGSGSTIKACMQKGINSIGIELDNKMFLLANKYINEGIRTQI